MAGDANSRELDCHPGVSVYCNPAIFCLTHDAPLVRYAHNANYGEL
jgi:hypothetical protein